MLKGWFDAFRVDGGPTLYSLPNRTPVIEDIRNILIYLTFSTLFVAFLIIFPGIRKERFSTLVCVTTSLFVGAVILIATCSTDWHVAYGSISSPYRAFSKEKLNADVGVRIGLNSVNITLQAHPVHRSSEDINYNERFKWIEASQMKEEYKQALVKGLPFPILTVAEYLSYDTEGFSWGKCYRKAGYYAHVVLWAAFAIWLLMNILLCAVPRYGAYAMMLTGVLVLLSNLLYVIMIPSKSLVIHVESTTLTFHFGWCFWVVLTAGSLSLVVGAGVAILDYLFPNKFSTIFEVDYDTPYRYFVGQDNTPKEYHHMPLREMAHSRKKVEYPSAPGPSGSQFNGVENAAYDDDDIEEFGTIINGKRAVSLQQFGKLAIKEANLAKKHEPRAAGRRIKFTDSSPQRSEVNIDIHAAAMW